MFVVPNSNATVEDDAKNSVFFAKESVSDLIHDEDGDYFEYNAIVDGKITTVKVKDTTTNAAKLNGLYKNYSTNNKGYVTSTSTYATYTDGDAKEYLTGAWYRQDLQGVHCDSGHRRWRSPTLSSPLMTTPRSTSSTRTATSPSPATRLSIRMSTTRCTPSLRTTW